MLCMLVAYDVDSQVIGTLDYMIARDDEGNAVGLVDFDVHERAGGALSEIWRVTGAVGSGTWPAWLGSAANDFRVELDEGFTRSRARGERPEHRIRALVHRGSGHRHDRAAIESAIGERIAAAGEAPADIRDLVGGPERPLVLDEAGRILGRTQPPSGTPGHLPRIGASDRGRSDDEADGRSP